MYFLSKCDLTYMFISMCVCVCMYIYMCVCVCSRWKGYWYEQPMNWRLCRKNERCLFKPINSSLFIFLAYIMYFYYEILYAVVSDVQKVDPQTAEAIDQFLLKLKACAKADSPFTFILDDPAGNSFIENP